MIIKDKLLIIALKAARQTVIDRLIANGVAHFDNDDFDENLQLKGQPGQPLTLNTEISVIAKTQFGTKLLEILHADKIAQNQKGKT